MSPLTRWVKFNIVGIAGMVVQLTALALFNYLLRGRYLAATALALEVTLLHNFAWHLRYTWQDIAGGSRWTKLAKFHLSNGLTSLAGNLLLMRLLVLHAHLQLLAANATSITACSLLNFTFSHWWTFADSPKSMEQVKINI